MATRWITKADNVHVTHRKQEELIEKAMHAYEIFAQEIRTIVVTSATDGSHMTGSRHYTGEAVDIRVWGLSDRQRWAIVTLLNHENPDEDWLDEDTHIHGEYDPKPSKQDDPEIPGYDVS